MGKVSWQLFLPAVGLFVGQINERTHVKTWSERTKGCHAYFNSNAIQLLGYIVKTSMLFSDVKWLFTLTRTYELPLRS